MAVIVLLTIAPWHGHNVVQTPDVLVNVVWALGALHIRRPRVGWPFLRACTTILNVRTRVYCRPSLGGCMQPPIMVPTSAHLLTLSRYSGEFERLLDSTLQMVSVTLLRLVQPITRLLVYTTGIRLVELRKVDCTNVT